MLRLARESGADEVSGMLGCRDGQVLELFLSTARGTA
jgi:hypothetical protein